MRSCATCGNNSDKAFQIVTSDGQAMFFDSFECAIHRLAPICTECGCWVIGHGSQSDNGSIFCGAHCAAKAGVLGVDTLQDSITLDAPRDSAYSLV
jgi:hypothetical protein